MNCRCLLKSTADAGDLRSKGLKRRVQLCLALANHSSCQCMIYEACLLDFTSTEKLRLKKARAVICANRERGKPWLQHTSHPSRKFSSSGQTKIFKQHNSLPSIFQSFDQRAFMLLHFVHMVLGSAAGILCLSDTCSQINPKLSLTKSLKGKQLSGIGNWTQNQLLDTCWKIISEHLKINFKIMLDNVYKTYN